MVVALAWFPGGRFPAASPPPAMVAVKTPLPTAFDALPTTTFGVPDVG